MIFKYIFCFILIKSLYVLTSGQPELNFFRSDYKVLHGTSGYYKLHIKAKNWWDAKERCDLEGTMLFYPESSNELESVMSYINETDPNIDSVYVGISGPLTKGVFLSVDGVPIRDLYKQWMPGEPNDVTGEEDCIVMNKQGLYRDDKCNKRLPYLCKKSMNSFTKWNKECNVPFLDYKLSKELNKCYKFHMLPKSWREAKEICDSEHAYLAIVNSKQESEYLSKITNEAPKNYSGHYLPGAVHLGYYFDETLEDWVTLKGDTLEQAGFSAWSYYQPDGGDYESCGSMFYNGELNDISCEAQNCYFICERDNDSNMSLTGNN